MIAAQKPGYPLPKHHFSWRSSLSSKPRKEILHLDFMLYGWLLHLDADGIEPLRELANPGVLLQGCESGGYGFIKSFRSDINRVFHISHIPNRYLARSQHHEREDSIFAFYSLDAIPLAGPIGTRPVNPPASAGHRCPNQLFRSCIASVMVEGCRSFVKAAGVP